jgi:hypothetical protein
LDLLRNANYLSAVAEDAIFRENQVAKKIADNIVGRGNFRIDSRQTIISNSALLTNYLTSYRERFFLGDAKVIPDENRERLVNMEDLKEFVTNLVINDGVLQSSYKMELAYPVGSEVEGQIVSIQDYGFFVEFGLDGNGLIHKSNFGVFGRDLTDLFEAGDWVVVEILGYKIDHRRFDLKLCGLAGDPVQVEAQSSVVPSS